MVRKVVNILIILFNSFVQCFVCFVFLTLITRGQYCVGCSLLTKYILGLFCPVLCGETGDLGRLCKTVTVLLYCNNS